MRQMADLRLVHSHSTLAIHLSIMRILCILCLLLAVVVAKKDLKKLQIGVKACHAWDVLHRCACLAVRHVHVADECPLSAPWDSPAAAQA